MSRSAVQSLDIFTFLFAPRDASAVGPTYPAKLLDVMHCNIILYIYVLASVSTCPLKLPVFQLHGNRARLENNEMEKKKKKKRKKEWKKKEKQWKKVKKVKKKWKKSEKKWKKVKKKSE